MSILGKVKKTCQNIIMSFSALLVKHYTIKLLQKNALDLTPGRIN